MYSDSGNFIYLNILEGFFLSPHFLALSALISMVLFHLKLILHRVREESATQFFVPSFVEKIVFSSICLGNIFQKSI